MSESIRYKADLQNQDGSTYFTSGILCPEFKHERAITPKWWKHVE